MAEPKGPRKAPKVSTEDLLRRWESDKKSRIFLQLADEYRKEDFVDSAISVLREGLKHHPTFVPAHVALARCYLAKSQLTQAQAQLEPVHRKAPDNLMAGKLLAEVLQERGEMRRALQVLEAVLPFASGDPEVEERVHALRSLLTPPKVRGDADTGGVDTAEFTTGEMEREPPPRFDMEAVEEAEVEPPSSARATPPSVAPAPIPESADAAAVLELTLPGVTVARSDPFGDLAEQEATEAPDAPGHVFPPMPAPSSSATDLLGGPRSAAPATDAGNDDFTSVTLAELYESQEAHAEAAAIYEALLHAHPEDEKLRGALERCRARLATGGHSPAVTPASPPPRSAPLPAPADRPRWEPVRARTGSVAAPSDAEDVFGLLEQPAAPQSRLPARSTSVPFKQAAADGGRSARHPRGSPAYLLALRSELERWLGGVKAVRQ